MKKYLCLLLILMITNSYAQKQSNVWHFGVGSSIDFSTGVPVATVGSQIETFEGCASYSDSLGNFLFYTNGGGREPAISGQDGGKIWNKNNTVMYDMLGTEGGGFSSAQSSVIFEAPGQPNIYYVFTMDEIEFDVGASPATIAAQPNGRGLSYFTVDMTLNGGLGGVVQANQQVYTPSSEGLCAIRHSNKRDYWIIINQDSTGLRVYSVNSSGVSFVSSYTISGGNTGLIKASPNGTLVRTSTLLLDFNNSTGQLSNPVTLPSGDYFEFSPNSRYLFDLKSVGLSINVDRYDLLAPSIPSSVVTIGAVSNPLAYVIGQMQLGPDGKVYFLTGDFITNSSILNRINCPNLTTAMVDFNTTSFPNASFGLPNFAAWMFENNDSTFVSLGPDTLQLCSSDFPYVLDAQNPGQSYIWSNGATSQTITINTAGTYSVTVNGPCGSGSDKIVIIPCTSTNNDCIVFQPTGALQQWTVPSGVNNISVKMWGAAGGGGPDLSNNEGGGGGYAEFSVAVVPGDLLQLEVGVGGRPAIGSTGGVGGWPSGGDGGSGNRIETISGIPTNVGGAGGGGGLSRVRISGSQNATLAIAGGGGGAAYNRSGGAGGGLEAEPTIANNLLNLQGFGGTQISGGNPASNTVCPHPVNGSSGSLLSGGNGATDLGGSVNDRVGGGGGGDGYYGGGGGGSQDGCFGVGSVGGGGSGFICSTCPNFAGSLITAGGFGVPANSSDTLLTSYPGTATGVINQNGGGGLIQICYNACPATTNNISITECKSFTNPLGTTYNQSGIYNYTLNSAAGCDSNIVLTLNITGAIQAPVQNISECSSYLAPWGTLLTQSGIYSDTLTTSNGCDSIVTINLTISGTIQSPIQTVSVCNNYTAPWGTIYTQTGIYSDTIPSVSGCDSIITVDLTVFGTSQPLVQSVSACNNYTAPWGTVYTQSGTYSDTLLTVNGCDSIVTINLTINIVQQPQAQNISNCNNYTAPWGTVYNQSGVYTDTLTSVSGCDSIVTINLTILGNTIAPLQIVNVCDSYTSPSGNIYNISGLYNDTITNSNGCDSIIPINLTVSGNPNVSITTTESSCSVNNGTAIAIASGGTSGYTYTWSNGANTSSISNLAPGNYSIIITDQLGCSDTAVSIITTTPAPSVNITASSSIIFEGDSVQLQASGAASYQWTPSSGLSCSNCSSPIAFPNETTTYLVTGTDSNGCTNSKSITITVDIICNELFVPTIFSPNSEGPLQNEKVCVYTNCASEINFAIYNRWGEMVFQTSDINDCWNGLYKGKESMSGVYAYKLFIRQLNGNVINKSGNITLVR